MIQNLLSYDFLLPYVAHKLSLDKAIRTLSGMRRRVLLIGHKDTSSGATATAPNNVLTKNIGTESAALAYLGEGSMLMAMWRAAAANGELGLAIDVLPLAEDTSATAATGTVTITGTPSANGEVMVHVAGERFSVGVTATDTPTTIAAKLVSAINAISALPVTAANTAGVITLTCRWKGLTGNDIDIRNTYEAEDVMAAGVTLTIAAMSGGTTNPALTPYVTAATNYRATEIVTAFTDSTSMGVLEAEQEDRWDCDNMQDGQVICVVRGTLSQHLTWLQPRNSKQCHSLHVYKDRTPPWATAAMAGAAVESQTARDTAVPFTGIKLVGYKAASQNDQWSLTDANAIAQSHGGVTERNDDGTGNLLRMFNHYKRKNGAQDKSARDLCWIKTGSYWRWFRVNVFLTQYRNGWKIAEYVTDPIPGQKIMTKELAQEVCIGLYLQFMGAGLFQNLEYYQKTMLVELDGVNGKVKVDDNPVLITQLYQIELTSNLTAGHV